MISPEPHRVQIRSAMLLICDGAGKVQAVTSKAACDVFPQVSFFQKDIAQVLGLEPAVSRWLEARFSEAQDQEGYSAETRFDNGEVTILAKLEALQRDRQLCGFALQIVPLMPAAALHTLGDGDSVIERKQWHEIKNQVGALKLYATFLKRKMAEGDERRIVEKIFTGVNDLIGYLDRIRRREGQ